MSVGKWAVTNGYIQCMGCKGWGPHQDVIWCKWNQTVIPYCTDECYEGDRQ